MVFIKSRVKNSPVRFSEDEDFVHKLPPADFAIIGVLYVLKDSNVRGMNGDIE